MTTIIAIAGASGAGKSLFANQLHERLRQTRTRDDVAILHEDAYYRRRDDLTFAERQTINYDHPDAIDHELLARQLAQLRNGQSVEVPRYDYSTHNRVPETDRLEPARILIVEGILILHLADLRDLLDLKVYVDVPLDVCLSRRLRRDVEERGRSFDSVLTQYHNTVRPMFFEFIEPSKRHADLIVPRGGDNEHAINVLSNHLSCLLP